MIGQEHFVAKGDADGLDIKWSSYLRTREIFKPNLPESILFFNEKYADEIRLTIYLLSPIAVIILIIRIKNWLCKSKKDRVCFECIKMPLEKGCPKCD